MKRFNKQDYSDIIRHLPPFSWSLSLLYLALIFTLIALVRLDFISIFVASNLYVGAAICNLLERLLIK